MNIKIIIFTLKQNEQNKFHYLIKDVLIPIYDYFNIEIITYGNSLENEQNYFLIVEHNEVEKYLKKSEQYIKGPKSLLESLIISKSEVVLNITDIAKKELQKSLKINKDFIYKDCT